MELAQRQIKSPIGPLFLVASPVALRGIFFEKQNIKNSNDIRIQDVLNQTQDELGEYFKGRRTHFNVPLDPDGTDFQKRVWKQLQKIPYGQTRSYKDIALGLKNPKASRAVGTANGKNPICIIIPCHRVITSNQKLGGYSGGLDKKLTLLSVENIDTRTM